MSAAKRRRQERATQRARAAVSPSDREAILNARRTLDDLTPRLNEQVAAARAAAENPPPEPPTPPPAPTSTGTIVSYEAVALPRGNVVVEIPSRSIEAAFATLPEAEAHADQLNQWLRRRPAPDARYRLFPLPPEPTAAALVDLIDRGWDDTPRVLALDGELAELVTRCKEEARTRDKADATSTSARVAAARVSDLDRVIKRAGALVDATEVNPW